MCITNHTALFIKFVSREDKYISSIWVDQKTKNVDLEKFLEQTTLKSGHLWPGEALEAWTWGWFIFQISSEKKAFQNKKIIFLHLKALPHDFFQIASPKNYFKNVQKLFRQAEKLFSAEMWKMPGCYFCANVMLRQPQVWASRASPCQKTQRCC